MSSDWNWQSAIEKESTVVPSVQAIAVYTNPNGDIVIRQQNDSYGEEDTTIILPRSSTAALTKALKAEAAKSFVPDLLEN